MMSKVNKMRSDDMNILFIDLEVTTEELNTERVQSVLGGGGQRKGFRSVASHCTYIVSLFVLQFFRNHVNI